MPAQARWLSGLTRPHNPVFFASGGTQPRPLATLIGGGLQPAAAKKNTIPQKKETMKKVKVTILG